MEAYEFLKRTILLFLFWSDTVILIFASNAVCRIHISSNISSRLFRHRRNELINGRQLAVSILLINILPHLENYSLDGAVIAIVRFINSLIFRTLSQFRLHYEISSLLRNVLSIIVLYRRVFYHFSIAVSDRSSSRRFLRVRRFSVSSSVSLCRTRWEIFLRESAMQADQPFQVGDVINHS